MPALAPVVLKDGAATPANHTYSPIRIDSNGVSTYNERVGGVPIGYPALTLSLRGPVNGGETFKIQSNLSLPKVVTTTDSSGKSVTSVDHTNLVKIEFTVSNKSDEQERKDAIALAISALQSAVVQAYVVSLEPNY